MQHLIQHISTVLEAKGSKYSHQTKTEIFIKKASFINTGKEYVFASILCLSLFLENAQISCLMAPSMVIIFLSF